MGTLRFLLVAVALCALAPATRADENVAITVKSMKPVDNGDTSVMVAVTSNDDHDFASISIACTVLSDSGAPLDVGYSTIDHLKVGETG